VLFSYEARRAESPRAESGGWDWGVAVSTPHQLGGLGKHYSSPVGSGVKPQPPRPRVSMLFVFSDPSPGREGDTPLRTPPFSAPWTSPLCLLLNWSLAASLLILPTTYDSVAHVKHERARTSPYRLITITRTVSSGGLEELPESSHSRLHIGHLCDIRPVRHKLQETVQGGVLKENGIYKGCRN